jgi:hypothetical protein
MRLLRPFVFAVALSGCYTYAPLKSSTPEPGQRLRVQLTLTGGDSLARFLGPNVASVDGRLVVANDAGFELGVTEVLMHSGSEQYWKGETVTLPKPYVASIQERTFSWGKSGLLAGVVVLVAAGLQSAGAFGGSSGHGNPPPPM